MNVQENLYPTILNQILSATATAGFQMASEPLTGSLLRTLAASKPKGNFLDLVQVQEFPALGCLMAWMPNQN